jgi:hypothetical protein
MKSSFDKVLAEKCESCPNWATKLDSAQIQVLPTTPQKYSKFGTFDL